jgi:hypothetical protein
MATKPKLVKLEKRQTPDDVRMSVERMLRENYPFACVAQRPDGEWETSFWVPPNMTRYQLVGALWSLQHQILFPESDDDDGD